MDRGGIIWFYRINLLPDCYLTCNVCIIQVLQLKTLTQENRVCRVYILKTGTT